MNRCIELFDAKCPPDFVILDRSVFTDRLFMNKLLKDGHIQQHTYDTYTKLWSMWQRLLPFTPDAFIYLEPSFSEIMNRVRERNRQGEKSGVTEEYQRGLKHEHDVFLKGDHINAGEDPLLLPIEGKPIWHLQTDDDYRSDRAVQTSLVDDMFARFGWQSSYEALWKQNMASYWCEV